MELNFSANQTACIFAPIQLFGRATVYREGSGNKGLAGENSWKNNNGHFFWEKNFFFNFFNLNYRNLIRFESSVGFNAPASAPVCLFGDLNSGREGERESTEVF